MLVRMGTEVTATLLDGALATSFVAYRIGRALRAAFPRLEMIEGSSELFDLDGFEGAARCTLRAVVGLHLERETHWNAPTLDTDRWISPFTIGDAGRSDGSLSRDTKNGVYEVEWEGHALVVAIASWSEGTCNHFHWFVLAEQRETADAFLVAVSRFGQSPRNEVLVVNGEWWRKDAELHATIRRSSFDELVLPETLRREIVEDFRTFLGSREEYARLGVPWKRGVLLLGPPGNGKTHCLRAILGTLELPIVYVQSLRSRYDTDERNIERVFDRVRRMAPCVAVFEDLDAQVHDGNRSFFLNQLDGFASNAGLLVIATTNHPERLDPSILERPSRFDRKYHFSLPTPELREAFLRRWSERIEPAMRPSDEQRATLVEATDGFSFAYLKELCLSALLRWMKQRPETGLYPILHAQLDILRAQMQSEYAALAAKATKKAAKRDDDD